MCRICTRIFSINVDACNLSSLFGVRGSYHEDEKLKTLANIELFLQSLSHFKTEDEINTPEAESYIKEKFEYFLLGCGFHMAESDFAELLEEVAGKPREDGTVGWYHQLSPVIKIFSLIHDKTLTLDMFEKYGGLETAVRTALRHDSLEDFGKSFEQFKREQKEKIDKRCKDLAYRQPGIFDEARRAKEHQNLNLLMQNLRLITKKTAVLGPDGKPQHPEGGGMVKQWCEGLRNDRDYMLRMLQDPCANPVVWLIKLCDGTNNLASMLGAKKFTADRRKEYANQRLDMLGALEDMNARAKEKWPDFAAAIDKFDNDIGMVLYINFGFLRFVDLTDHEFKEGDQVTPTGLPRYAGGALSLNVPRAFHSTHTLIDRVQKIQNGNMKITSDHPKADIQRRTGVFLENCIKPSLESHKQNFPGLFPATNGAGGHSRGAVWYPEFR